jgi:hypothetical protein
MGLLDKNARVKKFNNEPFLFAPSLYTSPLLNEVSGMLKIEPYLYTSPYIYFLSRSCVLFSLESNQGLCGHR